MTLNEAPEKIYLVPFGKKIIEPLPQEGSLADTIWSSKPYGNSNAGNIEYTRTDAFIEKACNSIEKLLSGYIIKNFNFGDSYDVDRLIEDFKNYMREE